MATVYENIIRVVNKVEGCFLIISVLLMAMNNVSNVVGRVLFNQSLFFTEELNSILIILITLLEPVTPPGMVVIFE